MKNLFKSLSAFQNEVPVIHKGTKGYGYSYADLPSIFPIINPLLLKHGLGFYQAVNGTKIKTVVYHIESAETIESETEIPQNVSLKGMNEFQVLGSAITYIRRYSLSSLLGLITDKDTDASGEQEKKEEPKKDTTAEISKLLESSKTLEELQSNYKSLSESDQKKFASLTTAIKQKLSITK